MSYELYVANYPSAFTRQDVENLFRDYKGIVLKKFIHRDQKCFSFITCSSMEQAMLIIDEKNASFAGGRKLVVKAQDKDLHSYIELLLRDKRKEVNSENDECLFVPPEVKKRDISHQKKFDHKPLGFAKDREEECQKDLRNVTSCKKNLDHRSPRKIYDEDPTGEKMLPLQVMRNAALDQKKLDENQKNKNQFDQLQDMRSKSLDQKFDKSHCFGSPPGRSFEKDSKNDSLHHQKVHCFSPYKEKYDVAPKHEAVKSASFARNKERNLEQFSNNPQKSKFQDSSASTLSDIANDFESLQLSPGRSGNSASPNANAYPFNQHSGAFDEFGWVCVANFPFSTTIGDLYRLFTDYNPLKVYIRYDLPEGEVTQALVLFSDQNTADDVILNFDNTIYKGHIILVSDISDISMRDELLLITHHA